MRRFWIIILVLAVVAAGCKKQTSPPTTDTAPPPETTVQTEPVIPTTAATEPVETQPIETAPPAPQTASATAIVDGTQIVALTLKRGTTVDVVGEYDDCYAVIKTESGYGLVERRLLHMSDAAAYEQWSGYAYSGAKLYNHYLCFPEEAQSLNLNTGILVLEAYGDRCVVQVGDTLGYMRLSEISKHYIQYTPGGGSQDGGDIAIHGSWGVVLLANIVPQEGDSIGTAMVIVDEAEVILGWYDQGEQVMVITEEDYASEREGFLPVWVQDTLGYVRKGIVQPDGAEDYVSWTGYAHYNAGVYDHYYLTGESVATLYTNQKIQVLWDLETCYLVQIGEDLGYMLKSEVSKTEIVYGGGDSGGEWSDPVM